MRNVEPTKVKCYNGEIVVTLNRGDFGFINFFVFPTAKYIADRDYEAASDL